MPSSPQKADLRLLSKVGKLYYERQLTQQKIADRLNLSRPKVSRLLQQAHREGIVQISVLQPPGTYNELENQLETTFDLDEAIVVEVENSAPQEAVSREIGIAASVYLQRTFRDRDVIGISWGTTLNAMVNALPSRQTRDAHIVQMIGGLGPPEAEVHATDLCRRLSRQLHSKLTLIPAPGIVDSQRAKDVLLTDRHVQKALDLFPEITVAYVGIGAPTPNSVVMKSGLIISQDELDHLLEKGVVGDIALRFFNLRGTPTTSEIDSRVIGITLEQLKQIPRVVGVAGGPDKAEVVCGALAGGFIDVLITDQITAADVFDLC
jgi:DNA-binding transcriptional regulator LsrR (DeoR family)